MTDVPLILNGGFGFSVPKAQTLSAPPYFLAAILTYVSGWVSDRYQISWAIITVSTLVEIVGLSLLGFAESNAVRYFGVFLTQAGSAVNLPAIITYQARNITGQWKRAFSSSIVVMFSGMGGIAGALIFRAQDGESLAPRVHKIIRFSQNSSSKLLSWALYLHWVGLKLTPFEETGKCLTRVRCNALLLSILGALSFFLRSANRRQQQGMLLIEKQVRML